MPLDGTLYVTNRGSGDLATLDEASLTVRKVIPVGERAWGVAVASDGKTACVSYGAGLAILNLEARAVEQRVSLGGQGMGVAIDTTTFQELRRISLGKQHEQVALDATGRRAYLTGGFALGGHDELTVVDLGTGTASRVGTGGMRPFSILRRP